MTTSEPTPQRLKSTSRSRSPSYSPPPANTLPPTNPPIANLGPHPPSSASNTIPYSPPFTSSLLPLLLRPPTRATKALTGLRVIAPGTSGNYKNAIKLKDVDWESLPEVKWSELPLGLGDERRRFASGILGVRLTHPGGRLEGGMGNLGEVGEGEGEGVEGGTGAGGDVVMLVGEGKEEGKDGGVEGKTTKDEDVHMSGTTIEEKSGRQVPTDDSFATLPKKVQDFLREHEIETQEQLQAVVKREREKQIGELRKCMKEREMAISKNEELDDRIEELVAERVTERKVYERARKAREKG